MDKIVNDFTINIATANGTGSQSANLILLQTLFDMGIPVSGKNLFPQTYLAFQRGTSLDFLKKATRHREIELTFRFS